jgi:hypothetical protein
LHIDLDYSERNGVSLAQQASVAHSVHVLCRARFRSTGCMEHSSRCTGLMFHEELVQIYDAFFLGLLASLLGCRGLRSVERYVLNG